MPLLVRVPISTDRRIRAGILLRNSKDTLASRQVRAVAQRG